MEYAQKKLELEFKFKLQAQAAQQPSSQFGGHGRPAANIYPTAQTSFHHHDNNQNSSGFSFQSSNYNSNSYSSQDQWQPNVVSSSTQRSSVSSASFPLASQSSVGTPYSGWESTLTDDTSKSTKGLSFTEQLNSNDDDALPYVKQ